MRYRLLGNSGLRVSEAALGTMTFGEDWGWGAAKDEARKVYDAFREAGGNFIDTANIYTNGTSESFLGEFMEGHRQSVVLATKYTNAVSGHRPERGRQPAQEYDAGSGSEPQAAANRLYRSLLGPHLGPDHAGRKRSCEDWMTWFAQARCFTRASPMLRPGGSRRRIRWRTCGVVALHRIADRIQPDRANRGARADPHGQGAEHRRDRVVATGRWRADRQVPRPRVV